MGACSSSKPAQSRIKQNNPDLIPTIVINKQDIPKDQNKHQQLIEDDHFQIENENHPADSIHQDNHQEYSIDHDSLPINEENQKQSIPNQIVSHQTHVIEQENQDNTQQQEQQQSSYQQQEQEQIQAITEDPYDPNDEYVQKPLETVNFINTGIYLMKHRNLNDVELLNKQKHENPNSGQENQPLL